MDSHPASSSSRPAKRNLNSQNVTPNVVGAPFAEESCSSRAPLCQPSARHQSDSKPTEESAISQHGGPNMNLAMHYLDNMHHATHWLKQHEIERKQTPLSHRLRSIKNGECLSILQQVSQAKFSSLRLQNSLDHKLGENPDFQRQNEVDADVVSNTQISSLEENEDGVTVKRLEVDPSEHDDGSQNAPAGNEFDDLWHQSLAQVNNDGGTTQDDGMSFEQMAHAIQLVKNNIQDKMH